MRPISRDTIYRMHKNGDIKLYRLGRSSLVKVEEQDSLIES
ncbi:hypothetical protein [Shimia sp. CNT1-13L.2]|nr:hypothetical protein [Shimia sp. CNT1-13L.2]